MISLVTLSILDVLLMIILYSFWPSIVNKKIRNPKQVSKEFIPYIWIICIIFCVYSGWDTDYAHYYEIFDRLSENPLSAIADNLEIIYIPIIDISFKCYSVFRLYIWGGAIFFLIKLLNNLKLNNDITAIIFVFFNLLYFSYARVSLATIIYFNGLYLFFQKHFRIKIIGMLLMLASIFFHKSMLFLIILTPLAFIKIDGLKVFFILLICPIFIVVVKYFSSYFLSSGSDSDTLKISSSAYIYSNNSSHSEGIVGLIIYFFEICSYIYGLLITWYSRKTIKQNRIINGFCNLTLGLIFISVISALSGLGYIITRRIFLISYLCMFVVLSYIFSYRFKKHQFVTFCTISFLFSSLKILYYLYVNKVSGY